MKLAQRLQSVLGEAAFAAGLVGVVGATLALFSVAAPTQMSDLCVSSRTVAQTHGLSWSCGAADRPAVELAPGQAILGH